MKRNIFTLTLGLLIATCSLQAQSAKQHFKTAESFYKGRQYQAAVDHYSKALEMDPDMQKAYIDRGKTYNLLGKHSESANDFDLALALEKKPDEQLLFWSGREWYLAGENQQALSRLSQVINMKPKFREAFIIRYEVYMRLENYTAALSDAEKCLSLGDDAQSYFNIGRAYEAIGNTEQAEVNYYKSIQKNDRIPAVHFQTASLLYKEEKFSSAQRRIEAALSLDRGNLDYLILQSQILAAQKLYPEAKEVLSRASVDHPDDERIYIYRGDYEMATNQPAYAIVEYTKAIELNKKNPEYYHKRGQAYEQSNQIEMAKNDYAVLLSLSEFDGNAMRLHAEVTARIFELNREEEKPVISILDPTLNTMGGVDVTDGIVMLNITGHILDASGITSLQVNGFATPFEQVEGGYKFMASINMVNTPQITIEVRDVYENYETSIFPVRITERDLPLVKMTAPYEDDGNLHVPKRDGFMAFQGTINDESPIVNIMVDSIQASFKPNSLNPNFYVNLDVTNKTSVLVVAEDKFGNKTEITYGLRLEDVDVSNNPMGKTWVLFIQNSKYKNFASLAGPSKDVVRMQSALSDYDIHRVWVKEDMSLQDMTTFFYYDLRDEIKKNNVNSLLIWYAGHGKYINETGYWIPTDASREQERSYYNINALKASLDGYDLMHTLVITDACETGPSFYRAMRSALTEPSCDDYTYTRFKSSQVFSSAGYELADDDSKFTEVFSKVLMEKRSSCVPIESVVLRVMDEVGGASQKPQFGKIEGMQDENGTFFFIPKDF